MLRLEPPSQRPSRYPAKSTPVHKILTHGNPRILEYKSTWHTSHVVLPALAAWAAEQVAAGLVPVDWVVATLAASPMYPGWEERWRRKQGF